MSWLASNWIWILLIGGGLLYLLRHRPGHGGIGHRAFGLGRAPHRSDGRHRRGGC